jgi:enhancing lycopene biosynthesis protein 2
MINCAVILSGCGSGDGSDVWETVLLSYLLSKKGINPLFFAPDWEQKEVVNHLSGIAAPDGRNVLAESARIAGEEIREIQSLSGKDVDALILPGGAGVVKNLSDLVGDAKKDYLKPKPELQRLIREIYRRKKPIGACGISAILVASALRDILETPLTITIGKDPELIRQAEGMGALNVLSRGTDAVIDTEHRLVTTPANLLKLKVTDLALSLENLVNGILELVSAKPHQE